MIRVAVTGGIGSGKSVVCEVFDKIGIAVFNADYWAKHIMNNNTDVVKQLKKLLGNDVYRQNGMLDRKKMAEIIFSDTFMLEKVNSIVHPVVRNEFQSWSTKQTSAYVIQEAAIIFENKQASTFDKIILVTAPEKTRIDRVTKRDRLKANDVQKRINNQLSDEIKKKKSDYIIINDNIQLILPQILKIDKQIREWRNLENG
jgi:dephospho-CoA kinase